MTPHKEWFKTYKPLHPQGTTFLGDGSTKLVEGIGLITLQLSSGITIDIHNVLYVPCLGKSLISIGQMTSSRVKLILDGDDCYINFKSPNKQQI
jgi:hypothetical protein